MRVRLYCLITALASWAKATTKKSIPIEVKAYKQEEIQLEEYEEEQILEEDVEEKEDVIYEEEIHEEEKEGVYSPYSSIFIKIMFAIGAFLVVSLIILKFRRKSKEQKPVLGKLEEETKEEERVEKEEKKEYEKEEAEPKEESSEKKETEEKIKKTGENLETQTPKESLNIQEFSEEEKENKL